MSMCGVVQSDRFLSILCMNLCGLTGCGTWAVCILWKPEAESLRLQVSSKSSTGSPLGAPVPQCNSFSLLAATSLEQNLPDPPDHSTLVVPQLDTPRQPQQLTQLNFSSPSLSLSTRRTQCLSGIDAKELTPLLQRVDVRRPHRSGVDEGVEG